MTAVVDTHPADTQPDVEEPLAVALGDTYGLTRAWRCIRLARTRADARRVIARRVWQDYAAIRDAAERAHARARATTVLTLWVLAIALGGMCGWWWIAVSPFVAWVPLVVAQAATAPLRWRMPAIFRRQCLRGQKVVKPVIRYATVHSADYRDHKAIDGDGMSNAAQRQEVVRSRRWITPRLYAVVRTGVGWEGRIRMPDTMTVDYFAEWATTVAAGQWASITVKADPDDRADGTFAIVRRDPLRGPPVMHPMLMQQTDMWELCEVAVDEAGRIVAWLLPYERILGGGVPDSGKSMLGTNALVHGACDPRAPLFIVDPSGVDYAPFEQCIAASGFGDYTRANTPSEVMRVMLAAEKEMKRREEWMQDTYAKTGEPKRKIEPGDPYAPGLFLLDEWARVRDSMGKLRDKFDEVHYRLLSNVRKCAICMIDLTQDPRYDATPVKHRNMHSIRAAHRVIGDTMSDIILGDGTAEAGRSAAREIDGDQPGVSLTLTRDGFTRVRSFLIEDRPLAEVAAFAARLRREHRERVEACGVVGGGSGVPGDSSEGGSGVSMGDGAGAGGAVADGSDGSGGSVNGDSRVDGDGDVGGRRPGGRRVDDESS